MPTEQERSWPFSGTCRHLKMGRRYSYEGTYWEDAGTHWRAIVRFDAGPGRKGEYNCERSGSIPVHLSLIGLRDPEGEVHYELQKAMQLSLGVAAPPCDRCSAHLPVTELVLVKRTLRGADGTRHSFHLEPLSFRPLAAPSGS